MENIAAKASYLLSKLCESVHRQHTVPFGSLFQTETKPLFVLVFSKKRKKKTKAIVWQDGDGIVSGRVISSVKNTFPDNFPLESVCVCVGPNGRGLI